MTSKHINIGSVDSFLCFLGAVILIVMIQAKSIPSSTSEVDAENEESSNFVGCFIGISIPEIESVSNHDLSQLKFRTLYLPTSRGSGAWSESRGKNLLSLYSKEVPTVAERIIITNTSNDNMTIKLECYFEQKIVRGVIKLAAKEEITLYPIPNYLNE